MESEVFAMMINFTHDRLSTHIICAKMKLANQMGALFFLGKCLLTQCTVFVFNVVVNRENLTLPTHAAQQTTKIYRRETPKLRKNTSTFEKVFLILFSNLG